MKKIFSDTASNKGKKKKGKTCKSRKTPDKPEREYKNLYEGKRVTRAIAEKVDRVSEGMAYNAT